ncbi:MAG TPA: response regulator [Longimicrobium sp.]|jgi:two-component system response regulator
MTQAAPLIILMADDDEDDRLLARDALRESPVPATLRFVEDGGELLEYLRRERRYAPPADAPTPSLVLLDLNMPRMGGMEALHEIRHDPALRRIPVVVMTTSGQPEDVARSYELGANSFITKPVTFSGLVEVMQSLGDYWGGTVSLPDEG